MSTEPLTKHLAQIILLRAEGGVSPEIADGAINILKNRMSFTQKFIPPVEHQGAAAFMELGLPPSQSYEEEVDRVLRMIDD